MKIFFTSFIIYTLPSRNRFFFLPSIYRHSSGIDPPPAPKPHPTALSSHRFTFSHSVLSLHSPDIAVRGVFMRMFWRVPDAEVGGLMLLLLLPLSRLLSVCEVFLAAEQGKRM